MDNVKSTQEFTRVKLYFYVRFQFLRTLQRLPLTRDLSPSKESVKLRFGGRQSKKSRWNYFESLQDSKATRQEIENFTSLREG